MLPAAVRDGGPVPAPRPLARSALAVLSSRPLLVSALAGVTGTLGLPIVALTLGELPDALPTMLPASACVLVDVCDDPEGAVAACALLDRPGTPPVVLFVTADRSLGLDHLAALLRCRPAGLLGATTTPEELTRALRLVIAGQLILHLDRASEGGVLLERWLWGSGAPNQASGLSEEEHVLLGMVTAGLSDEEIAARLFLSEATVRRRVSRLRARTATGKRAELAAWGGAHGYYRPGGTSWLPPAQAPVAGPPASLRLVPGDLD